MAIDVKGKKEDTMVQNLMKDVAKDLVTGALGSLISKLGGLLHEEYKLQKGVSEKIVSVIEELECAQAAMRKVAAVPSDNLDEQVKIWAREVREESYDMEDVLDTFLVSAQSDDPADDKMDHQLSLFKRLKKKMAHVYDKVVSGPSKYRKISLTIDDINERLKKVTERRQRYTVPVSNPSPTSTVDPRLKAIYKEVTELVGIEKPSAKLISMLSLSRGDEASSKKMKTVSVVGTGGLGKTTLVKAVYDKLKTDFECKAFVSVGRNPDLKKVFRDILIELDKNKYLDIKFTKLDEKQLIDELREYLGRKRYLVVIDDIWEEKSWATIRVSLVKNNSGSRVITTTRKLDVAEQAHDFHKLESLPYEKSRKLFYMRIFGAEDNYHDTELDKASDKILKKCAGVPLAIITMASLLVGKSKEEWIEVCDSIAFRDKNKNEQVNDTEWILSLSYDDLPAHLKTCLLYLSAFPEDYIINRHSLIWKWVAEGFIHNKESGTGFFEIGEGYFDELVNRSMIQEVDDIRDVEQINNDFRFGPPSKARLDGRKSTGCRLHDMVLDLLRVKSQEENFMTISRNNVAESTSLKRSKVRRLANQGGMVEQTNQDSTGMHLQKVRTFIGCRCAHDVLSVHSFQLLRVLALEYCSNKINLVHVNKLLHLRYLGLRDATFDELPEGIGALKFMQIIEIRRCSWKSELPYNLSRLTQLICLCVDADEDKMMVVVPNGVIEKLTSLQKLKISCPDNSVGHFVKELGKLRELRVLHCIQLLYLLDEKKLSDFLKSLSNLQKVQCLTVLDNRKWSTKERALWDAVVLPPSLQRFNLQKMGFRRSMPSCINPSHLPNLTHLTLDVPDLDENSLKILGVLPELRHLKLTTSLGCTVKITTHTADDVWFPKLRSCSLHYAMPLFVLNEDLTISFTISCDYHDGVKVAFGSATDDDIVLVGTIMPKLQHLGFHVDVLTLTSQNGSCDKLGLEYLPSLEEIGVIFHSLTARDDNDYHRAALSQAIKTHPNKPTLHLIG